MNKRKPFFLIALLPLILALSQAPRVMAQDEPPSENGAINVVESGTLSLVPLVEKSASPTDRAAPGGTRDLTPKTGILDIASSDDFESDSDIAFGNSVYGIAYEREGHIYVAFFNASGHLLSRYPVTGGNANHSHPAIAFEGASNVFVVAYQYDFGGGDVDIYAHAVSPFSGNVGIEVSLTDSTYSEADPDLDCNHDDTSCLVVFSYSSPSSKHIQGRFVNVSSFGISPIGDNPFRVSTSNNVVNPHVAWGWNNGRYMVVYHAFASAGDDVSEYSHVYDTFQSSGNQYIFGSTYLINPSDLDYDIFATGITYDPVTEKFLTLVTHDFYGTGSDFDVRLHVNSASGSGHYTPTGLIIADWSADETLGSISFMNNAWSARFDPGQDKVAIAYLRTGTTTEIVTTVITGNGSKISPDYEIPEEIDHLLVKTASGAFGSFVPIPLRQGAMVQAVTWFP